MNQEAVEGAMDGASDERSDRQAIDHEAVKGDMDQEAVEGAVVGASDERSDRWYKRWITKQSKEIWIRKLSRERSGCCHILSTLKQATPNNTMIHCHILSTLKAIRYC
jgi:hypothetical protein